jgi:hypothetical protein
MKGMTSRCALVKALKRSDYSPINAARSDERNRVDGLAASAAHTSTCSRRPPSVLERKLCSLFAVKGKSYSGFAGGL